VNLTKCGVSGQIFVKAPNIKSQEYPSSGTCGDKCGQTDRSLNNAVKHKKIFRVHVHNFLPDSCSKVIRVSSITKIIV
jgi:hypothetical protein